MDIENEIEEEKNLPENQASDSSIENEVSLGKAIIGSKNFDEQRFRQDAELAKQEGRDFRSLNKKDYVKRKDPPGMSGGGFSSPNLSFSAKFENGIYTAVGSNGQVIKSADFKDFATQLALSFKNSPNVKNPGEPHMVEYKRGPNSKYTPQQIEQQTKIFINNGVGIYGDVPKNPEFWQQFKNEYLNNKNNTPEMWNKLTSRVNPEYMSPQANNNLGRFLHNMRMGTNTNLTPRRTGKPRRSTLSPQMINQMQGSGRN